MPTIFAELQCGVMFYFKVDPSMYLYVKSGESTYRRMYMPSGNIGSHIFDLEDLDTPILICAHIEEVA